MERQSYVAKKKKKKLFKGQEEKQKQATSTCSVRGKKNVYMLPSEKGYCLKETFLPSTLPFIGAILFPPLLFFPP